MKDELVIAMKANSEERIQWKPCPPGELSRIASGLRRRRRIRMVTRVTTVAALLLVMVGGGVYVTSKIWSQGDNDFGGITCTTVRAEIPRMMAGTLDQETMMRIQKHLELCPKCKPLADQVHEEMQKMQKGMKMGQADCHDRNCPCARHARVVAEHDASWNEMLAGTLVADYSAR